MRRAIFILSAVVIAGGVCAAFGGLGDSMFESMDHPAIQYTQRTARDPVARLNQKIEDGEVKLAHDNKQGYLRALLEALHIPVESQIAIFSKTSVQMQRIEPGNPRTLFFNDQVIVGYVRGGFIELAAQDPDGGMAFYELNDLGMATPVLLRSNSCLNCHESYASLGVPGVFGRSVFPARSGAPLYEGGSVNVDHRTPFEKRWGGYYVTGESGPPNMGNSFAEPGGDLDVPLQGKLLATLDGRFDTNAYLSPKSDVVALMVFDHQMQMMNLLTRVGWEVRAAFFDQASKRGARDMNNLLRTTAREIVDYMLFVDEARLDGKVEGSSGFAKRFAAQGPRDSKGRSLRDFDLEKRLFRYPLSYMIYSPAFDALPSQARVAIYRRLEEVLTGPDNDARYAGLSSEAKTATWEILRETKTFPQP